jgi:hypothetical protein
MAEFVAAFLAVAIFTTKTKAEGARPRACVAVGERSGVRGCGLASAVIFR